MERRLSQSPGRNPGREVLLFDKGHLSHRHQDSLRVTVGSWTVSQSSFTQDSVTLFPSFFYHRMPVCSLFPKAGLPGRCSRGACGMTPGSSGSSLAPRLREHLELVNSSQHAHTSREQRPPKNPQIPLPWFGPLTNGSPYSSGFDTVQGRDLSVCVTRQGPREDSEISVTQKPACLVWCRYPDGSTPSDHTEDLGTVPTPGLFPSC